MRFGVRLQILLALGALLVVAFVPLYVAVARLTEASLAAARRDAALDLGRAVASHVLSAQKDRRSREALEALLASQISEDGSVRALGMFGRDGAAKARAGELELLPESVSPSRELAQNIDTPQGPGLLVLMPTEHGDGAVAVVLALAPPAAQVSPLGRLVGFYTGVVALTLLIFAYFVMTRLVVRPLEDVSRAAGRIASGSRHLDLVRPNARELAELADSLTAMTERLLAEEQALLAKVEELERAKRQLESAQENIVRSERLASVGRLAAGVAHEIGNPIAAILGFEELLLQDDLPDDERRDFLVRMKSETERVNRVLRDLLDFARPSAASVDPASDRGPRHASVRDAAELIAALVKPQRRMHHAKLELSVPADVPLVAISAERLQQVLLNLILNAADAAKSKVRLSAERCADEPPRVRIVVEDDGPGVSDAVKGRLFEPFVTTKEVGKGTGLGLAVCRGLVESAGGTITLAPSSEGARFELTLPAVLEPLPRS